MVFLFAGCQGNEEFVLLRYSPLVGSKYSYTFNIIHPETPIEIPVEIEVLEKNNLGYLIHFSNITNELFSGQIAVSERHNTDHPGYISLNFPEDLIPAGSKWTGEVPWYYEDYYVLDRPKLYLPASYRLLSLIQNENNRYATIEQTIEADIAVDGLLISAGQVGVKWDRTGRISFLDPRYDSFGKLKVGDIIIGINEHIIESPSELRILAEQIIQHPKQNFTVIFNINRNGEQLEIEVNKSIDDIALVKVFNKHDIFNIIYDTDHSILVSVEMSSNYDVAYSSLSQDPFPIVDDYGGFHKFGYLRGQTSYIDHLDSDGIAWKLSLEGYEEENSTTD